ncbi:MAG: type I methionyl aminopeptidase [Nitrospirae bacterium]|nr:MAG: type I methionyl aminopeptidase [Nitrospirota bacterium]
MIIIKKKEEIRRMARACDIVVKALNAIKMAVRPGVSTGELEKIAQEVIMSEGGSPTFKGYRGYPACLCASVNDEVVHGIPSMEKRLGDGDILSVDIGVTYKGWIGDAAITMGVGSVSDNARRLMETTREALHVGVNEARPGRRLTDISHAIQTFVESRGYSVVRAFVGHGVGRSLHEEPQIPNFGPPGKGPVLRPGMTLAIEPMVNEGAYHVVIDKDGWTARTKDGSLSAHFEHTVLVTENGPEILTKWE